ncbi:MAG: hypothetical protein ABIR87_00510 [Sphingomicrobium sp.]
MVGIGRYTLRSMNKVENRGPLDWLVEVAGASAPALAASFAAAKLAPINGFAPATAALVAGGSVFAAAWTAMRMVPAEVQQLALADFAAVVLEDELLLDQPLAADELLLDEPLVAETAAVAELLLDDPLPTPANDSRVVQLFADGRLPHPGQLKERIDRHLADGGKAVPMVDASDALSEALAELRRSLRQA